MGMILEVVGRNGVVIRRHSFSENKVSVGRAFTCDLILSDTHVDAVHLVVSLDADTQAIRCEDQNTLNGTSLVEASRFKGLHRDKRTVQGLTPIFSGQAIALGRSYLRVYSSTHCVQPAQALSAWESFGHLLGNYAVVLLLSLAVIALATWDGYLNNPQAKKIVEYVIQGLYPILAAILYAFLWAIVGKNAKHDGKLFTHLSVGLVSILAWTLTGMFLPPVVYALGWGGIELELKKLAVLVIVYSSLSVTLIFASSLKRVSRNLFALFIPLLFLIPYLLNVMTRPDFQSRPAYDSSLARPVWSIRAPVSTTQFLDSAQSAYLEPDVEE